MTVTAVLAETTSLPGSGWWSGEQVQNVGTTNADIYITAYDSQSSSTYETSKNLNRGVSWTFLPWDIGLPGSFQGSALLTSASDLRAIVNLTVKYNAGRQVGDPSSPSPATGQYQGFLFPSGPVSPLYFPLVKNNHFSKTTNFAIQNAGGSAATALATFTMPSSCGSGTFSNYTYTTPSISPNKMVIISPSDAGVPACNGMVGSLVVTSGQQMAGTALEFITGEVHPTVLQTMRGFIESDKDTTFYAPIIKNAWFNRNTGIQVQNVSGGTVNITVTYKGNPGAAACANQTYTDTHNGVLNGNSSTFLSNAAIPANCLAAAEIDAVAVGGSFTPNILAIVNESYSPTPPGHYQEATSYNAFPLVNATSIVSIPLFKENSFGKSTGISIQNVSSSAANNVVAKFIGPTGTYITNAQHIDGNGNLVLLNVRNQPGSFWNGTALTPAALGCAVPDNSTGCGGNGIFGVIITSDQPIVAIANESSTVYFLQDKNNYEGFNLLTDPTAP